MMSRKNNRTAPADNGRRKEIRAYGIRALLSGHPRIRQLKRRHTPLLHGNKLWSASWLLMDFFKKKGLPEGSRVLELGCGWGLASIYCAKKFGALVTGVDTDADVFPYLHLHADVNGVEIGTLQQDMNRLRKTDLEGFDIVMGADICFWESMTPSLKRLINRALRGGVQAIVIADPGRKPFLDVADHYVQRELGHLLDWGVKKPKSIPGHILQIGVFDA
jgi:predicted nicotinamide N-methyase